jgi:hypothetical protein
MDGPAVVSHDGSLYWYRNGKLHRKNGPSVINDKIEEWYENGQLHRHNGPAFVVYLTKECHVDSELHKNSKLCMCRLLLYQHICILLIRARNILIKTLCEICKIISHNGYQ